MGTTQLESVPEPKYWHLRTVLSEALDSEFAVGQVLPNERDLAAIGVGFRLAADADTRGTRPRGPRPA
ncbi:hypothetical protein ADL27_24300 [Streptomyces sp. NRRL F-6602]|nr:hypothetical protein ADL27_24300 [Streptomyces sp. NRRL F-6602]